MKWFRVKVGIVSVNGICVKTATLSTGFPENVDRRCALGSHGM